MVNICFPIFLFLFFVSQGLKQMAKNSGRQIVRGFMGVCLFSRPASMDCGVPFGVALHPQRKAPTKKHRPLYSLGRHVL